jgi:uncharacterized coiled-coil protein SlyX
MTTLHLRNSSGRSPLRFAFLLIPLLLVCFGLSPAALALLPAPTPDGGYPGGNTAEGNHALFNLTSGVANTADGHYALYHNAIGSYNTATGFYALINNTASYNTATGSHALLYNSAGTYNTANGDAALYSNTTGTRNTATGSFALYKNNGSYNTATGFYALTSNTSGTDNTATGAQALQFNQTGHGNTATGFQALEKNTTGGGNTAVGTVALYGNTAGQFNTAIGSNALDNNNGGSYNTAVGLLALNSNTAGQFNTAIGEGALRNSTGSYNTALGFSAGSNLTTGSNNIDIGNSGVAGESNTIRIGGNQTAIYFGGNNVYMPQIGSFDASAGDPVYILNGRLGFGDVCPPACTTSSERLKDNIKPMDKASEAILALKPVTFRYKKEFKKQFDPKGIPQFGLVAEEVQKVNPDLVVRDSQGKPYGVRYDAVNAMLLNEFLKEHRTMQEQKMTISELKSAVAKQEAIAAQQQKQIETLTAGLQKVSAQVEMGRPAPQTVGNNQ